MKKLFAICALLGFSLAAFGQIGLSAGAGVSFAPVWMTQKTTFTSPYEGEWREDGLSTNVLCFKAFVDAKYIEADVGYMTSLKGYTQSISFSSGLPAVGTETAKDEIDTWISLTALFKYPFKLKNVDVFPLAGFEFNYNLSAKDSDGNDLKPAMTDDQKAVLNQLWLMAGAGADFKFSKALYLRPEALVGFKFLSQFEKDNIETAEAVAGVENSSIIDLKIEVSVAVGYRF